MSKQAVQSNDDPLPISELESLKARAALLKIPFHPAIGLDKLREKVNAHIKPEAPAQTVAATLKTAPDKVVTIRPATPAMIREQKRKEGLYLTRVQLTCMNPSKKEWEGEIFDVGNKVLGMTKKFVPFNVPTHVPKILLNAIEERQCQIFVSKKDSKGRDIRTGKLIKEFNVSILPPLTKKELVDLAHQQALNHSIDK